MTSVKLVVLGSGSSVPHPRRAASAFWLETSAGRVLLDAGADAAHRAAAEGLPWTELDAIWISHFHLDHIGGLAPYLFGTKYAPETQARRKPLTIFGTGGLRKVFDGFDRAAQYELLKQPFPVEIREVDEGEEFDLLPGVAAMTLSTPHTDESLALHLRIGEKVLCYTADTGYTETLIDFAREADLLIIEASFWQASPVKTHLTLRQAVHIAQTANARRTILTHLYPEWDGVNVEAEARKLWTGDVREANDGLSIEF